MGRRPGTTTSHTLADALRAARQIRRLRLAADDRDLPFFPPAVDTDDDVDEVVTYTARHRRVPAETLTAELPHRAVLVGYQHQRDLELDKRRTLAILQAGHDLKAPPRGYGPPLGLPTRAAVYIRRVRLAAELTDMASEASPQPAAEQVRRWLDDHAGELADVAAILVDHRDQLCGLVREQDRPRLAEAIDAAGSSLAARPSLTLASAISYAVSLLAGVEPSDWREVIQRAMHLRQGLEQVKGRTRAMM